ncbi:hypothetical protein LSTR_LSTR017587 [Laodelphax striatellus]|uniref:Uncharacterized protein n=1 Tax=Laodelphax striatellus TaxID=195883 RepID=A0A482WRK6_LAOST|nr:hypothetical protein LSTR_LSTR017587 [Laodelphax striatellus]
MKPHHSFYDKPATNSSCSKQQLLAAESLRWRAWRAILMRMSSGTPVSWSSSLRSADRLSSASVAAVATAAFTRFGFSGRNSRPNMAQFRIRPEKSKLNQIPGNKINLTMQTN